MFSIFKKEFLELIRDKKTLFLTIALPFLILPMMYGVMAFVGIQASAEANSSIDYVVINAELAPEFQVEMDQLDNMTLSAQTLSSDQIEPTILSGELDLVIEFMPSQVAGSEQRIVKVYYDASNTFSDGTRLIRNAINKLNDQHNLTVLSELGLTSAEAKTAMTSLDYQSQEVSSPRAVAGGILGGMVSFMIIISILSTAIALASDLGAGEKERFTLEPLLITPQSRLNIALGKWLTLTVYAVINAALTVASLALTAFVVLNILDIPQLKEILGSFPLSSLIFAWLMLVPLAGLISAIMLATSSFASSFKEAQSYGSVVLIMFMLPSIVTIQGAMKLEGLSAWTPVINVSLSIIDILKGEFELFYLLPVLGSNLAALSVGLLLTIYLYRQESVMFRG